MKTTNMALPLFIVIGILLVFVYIEVSQVLDRNRTQQAEIEGLRKRNKKESDSLNHVLKVTQDSLSIAFETIKQARVEREEAHLRTQKTIHDLQKIIFVVHTDSSRLATLKNLYPTFNH